MKERNRNIRYENAVSIRLLNRRITVTEQDNGRDFVCEYVYARPLKDWDDKHNKQYDIIIKRCGIVIPVTYLKLSTEGMEATVSAFLTLKNITHIK